ncbi:hypothetical protein HVL34_000156 [Escherichia coli]|nr:hypothetical protein [Escherichia coli]
MIFTKEQLTRIIESADEVITALAGTNDDIHPDNSTKMCAAWDDLNDRNAPPSVVKRLAELALAGMEAEPVAYMIGGHYLMHAQDPKVDNYASAVPLYTAPPAPVSVPAAMEMDDDFDSAFEHGKAVGWNAYRAAMLQGADGTLADEGTIPAMLFKPVADLYGLTSPTGGEASFTFDAVEARDFIDGGWSCQEYVELGRFQEAMLQNGNSPAQSDCCPEQNYIAPAQDGDSPVIPDGWVLVPEEPTHEMLEAGDEQFGTYDVYRRMIAASPQQK